MKIINKVGIFCIILVIVSMGISVPVNAADKIKVFINRAEVNMNIDPVVINGRTLIPIRSIFEALGAEVNWDSNTRRVTATRNGIKIELTIGANTAYKNGQIIATEVPAQIIDSRTYVPLRFITEALDFNVYWNAKIHAVYISTKGPDPELAQQEQLSQVKTWKKVLSTSTCEMARFVQQTKDGGYILFGDSCDDSRSSHLIKLNSLGDIMWDKTIGKAWAYDAAVQTDQGYLIVLGDGHCIETDENGNIQQEKTLELKDNDISPEAALQTPDGGFVIAGHITRNLGNNVFKDAACLVKIDENADIEWKKTYEDGIGTTFCSVKETDGGYIMAGNILLKDGSTWLTTDRDLYIVKTDENGNVEWKRNIGGGSNDYAEAIELSKDGGYLVAGSTNSFGAGCSDALIVSLNRKGNTKWQKTFGGPGDEYASSIVETENGNIVFAGGTELFSGGTHNRKFYFAELDTTGKTIFEKSFGANNYDGAASLAQCFDGGYVLAGYSANSLLQGGHSRCYIIKTDSNGNVRQ